MKYNINNNISQVFLNIQKEIEESKDIINELLKIDYQYSNLKVDIEELIDMLYKLKDEKVDIKKEQIVEIRYNGNPIITLNLILLAILTKTIIVLDFDQSMFGVNSFIIKITNNILNNVQTDNLVYLKTQNNYEVEKIICIDDIYKYNTYIQDKNINVKFYAFNYIDFYRDNDDFEDVTDLMYQYAEQNQIPIESYSEFELEEAVEMIEMGRGTTAVILTNREETEEIFKRNIKTKKLIINENPFKQNKKIINKEIFYI